MEQLVAANDVSFGSGFKPPNRTRSAAVGKPGKTTQLGSSLVQVEPSGDSLLRVLLDSYATRVWMEKYIEQ